MYKATLCIDRYRAVRTHEPLVPKIESDQRQRNPIIRTMCCIGLNFVFFSFLRALI